MARFDIYSLNRRLLFLPRATGVRPPACHPLRSWPAGARAATVSATLRPGLAGRAADIDFLILYLLLFSYCSLPGLLFREYARPSLCFRLVLSHVIRSELLEILCNLVCMVSVVVVAFRVFTVVLFCILTGTVESAKLRIVLWTPRYLPLVNVFMHLPWAYTNPHGFCP